MCITYEARESQRVHIQITTLGNTRCAVRRQCLQNDSINKDDNAKITCIHHTRQYRTT